MCAILQVSARRLPLETLHESDLAPNGRVERRVVERHPGSALERFKYRCLACEGPPNFYTSREKKGSFSFVSRPMFASKVSIKTLQHFCRQSRLSVWRRQQSVRQSTVKSGFGLKIYPNLHNYHTIRSVRSLPPLGSSIRPETQKLVFGTSQNDRFSGRNPSCCIQPFFRSKICSRLRPKFKPSSRLRPKFNRNSKQGLGCYRNSSASV